MDSAGNKEVMTAKEAAVFLRITPQTVRSLARRGDLPGRKVGRAWRFSKEGLENWLKRTDGERDS